MIVRTDETRAVQGTVEETKRAEVLQQEQSQTLEIFSNFWDTDQRDRIFAHLNDSVPTVNGAAKSNRGTNFECYNSIPRSSCWVIKQNVEQQICVEIPFHAIDKMEK